jgi:hypothetical protein
MDSFETSLGVPGARVIEPIHDRQSSPKQRQEKNKQRQKDRRAQAGKASAPTTMPAAAETQEKEKTPEPDDSKIAQRGKGDFIDIQA